MYDAGDQCLGCLGGMVLSECRRITMAQWLGYPGMVFRRNRWNLPSRPPSEQASEHAVWRFSDSNSESIIESL